MRTTWIFFLFLFFPFYLFSQTIDILPEKIIYNKYYADALSHQFSLSKDFESSQWFGNVGAVVPVLDLNYRDHLLQISAASTVYNTIIKTPGHIQVYTVDYLVDFFFDYNIHAQIPVRFIFGHLSAHYSDDGIVELNNYPLSYVRDYIGLHSQYNFIDTKIYGGVYYNFHIEPELSKKITYQLGGDRFFKVIYLFDLYVAADFKLKSEVGYVVTQSYQIGLKLSGSNRRAVRLGYTFRDGYEERGQLYNIKDKKHMLGIFLDF
jgi:hypothetical protein